MPRSGWVRPVCAWNSAVKAALTRATVPVIRTSRSLNVRRARISGPAVSVVKRRSRSMTWAYAETNW